MKKMIAVASVAVLVVGCQTTGDYKPVSEKLPSLNVSFTDSAWNGKKLPNGQQCSKFGGKGSTPSMMVSGIPSGVNAVIVEFNDEDYAPLSSGGGHGSIGFWVSGSSAKLISAPGETDKMPSGVFIERKNGSYYTAGYLPPCSGGKGNTYSAVVKAVYKAKKEGEPSKLFAVGNIKLADY